MKINDSGKNNKVIIDPTSLDKINAEVNITFKGNNHKLIIGKNAILNKGEIIFEDIGGTLLIGDNTLIYENFKFDILEGKNLIIEKNCLFSKNVAIRTGDSHSIIDITDGKRINNAKNVTIGEHVWICEGTKIMKGAYIRKDSVVGAWSLVTGKDFPPNSIIAGSPAHVVKSNINWNSNLL